MNQHTIGPWKYRLVRPKIGDVVQITSCLWYVWVRPGKWKKMTVDEQLEYSK